MIHFYQLFKKRAIRHWMCAALFLMCCTVATAGTGGTPDRHLPSLRPVEDTYKVVYADSILRISVAEVTCSGKSSLKLKFENLTENIFSFSWSIWEGAQAKTTKLFSKQVFEGICAPEYNNQLIEVIPDGATVKDVKVKITY